MKNACIAAANVIGDGNRYHPHFVPPEAAIPRTVAGESNFIQGWVL